MGKTGSARELLQPKYALAAFYLQICLLHEIGRSLLVLKNPDDKLIALLLHLARIETIKLLIDTLLKSLERLIIILDLVGLHILQPTLHRWDKMPKRMFEAFSAAAAGAHVGHDRTHKRETWTQARRDAGICEQVSFMLQQLLRPETKAYRGRRR